ncbi:MAG: sulfatase-like hydrolase/transferase [Rikenellaceae bacterium]
MKQINYGVAALTGALALSSTAAQAAQSERPNIIFILTDDQPYTLLGCTGHPVVKTPNIDKLANEGVLFHNAHVSSAISKPSRTCILTGRFERNHGVNFNSGTALSAEAWEECYPVVLRKSGYYTGYIGKNHTPVGEKGYKTGIMDKSFDYWYAGHEHLGFYPKERHAIFKEATATTQVEVLEEGVMDFLNPNERNLKGAVHFLNSRDESKPFFLNICFNLPHGAGTSTMRQKPTDPELYRTGYRDQIDQIPLPQNYIAKEDIIKQKLPHSVFHPEDRQDGYNYVDTPETLRERNVREMEAVTGIDNLVGELMAELKRQKLDKNTIIIFTADHGIFNGEYGLGGKSLCYEICTKVPFIIYDPRAPKSQRKADNDELVLTIDLSKTILSYGDIKAPESYQGEDLTPMLDGEKSAVREWLFTECLWSTPFGNPRCESVQNKEWKYIRYYKNENQSATKKMMDIKAMGLPPMTIYRVNMSDVLRYRGYVEARLRDGEEPVYEELYNLKNDPFEAHNLIDNNIYAGLVEELREECDRQLKFARGTGAPRVNIFTPDYPVIAK